MLFVHGGAWRRGRRDDMGLRTRHWAPGPFARIAAADFAVACAAYRLSVPSATSASDRATHTIRAPARALS
ncbi:hypothetical protein [Streptomyces sp. NPDC002851]